MTCKEKGDGCQGILVPWSRMLSIGVWSGFDYDAVWFVFINCDRVVRCVGDIVKLVRGVRSYRLWKVKKCVWPSSWLMIVGDHIPYEQEGENVMTYDWFKGWKLHTRKKSKVSKHNDSNSHDRMCQAKKKGMRSSVMGDARQKKGWEVVWWVSGNLRGSECKSHDRMIANC